MQIAQDQVRLSVEHICNIHPGSGALFGVGSSFELVFEEGTSTKHAYELYARSFGPLRELLGLIGAEVAEALRTEFIEIHEPDQVPAGIAIPRPYLIVVGKRSSN